MDLGIDEAAGDADEREVDMVTAPWDSSGK
jgi:hypothetical protein